MLKLYDASNLSEAHLLLGLLSQAGIAAQILNTYAQGATGEIPFGQASFSSLHQQENRPAAQNPPDQNRFACGPGQPAPP